MRSLHKALVLGVIAVAVALFCFNDAGAAHKEDKEDTHQIVCFPGNKVRSWLFMEGYMRNATGIVEERFVLEFWEARKDTRWAMFLRDPQGNMCPFSGGVGWEWVQSRDH